MTGLTPLACLRLIQGFYANMRYENQYLKWRADRSGTASGLSWARAGLGSLLWLAIVPLTLYRFTIGRIEPALEPFLTEFPVEKKPFFAPVSIWLDGGFDLLSIAGAGGGGGSTVWSPRSARFWMGWKPCLSMLHGLWS